MGEPIHVFLTALTMFKYCISSDSIQYCINNIDRCYFTVALMWPKFHYATGPKAPS